MPANSPDADSDSVQGKMVCSACIGDGYLRQEVERSGAEECCDYCENDGKCWNVGVLADRIEKAFEQHFERTPENPDALEEAMSHDPDSSYGWERRGVESKYAITDAVSISELLAEDIREILSDRHYDRHAAEVNEEQEFDPEAYYEETKSTGAEYQEAWAKFEKCVREESRYFAPVVQGTLDRVFEDVFSHRTASGGTVVINAGPGRELVKLFRARVFQAKDTVLEAIERPDLHLGPPPAEVAKPGRMNAAGISVFYGAKTFEVAIAEVRPPVGSRVAVGIFEITRPLRLLDLDALVDVNVKGSIFDPAHFERLERAAFLRIASALLSRPVMPEDEAAGYLVTQVVADYLANVPKLDGMIFRSVQSGAEGANVVLFHHASRVEHLKVPDGGRIEAFSGFDPDDEEFPDYSVSEEFPSETAPERVGHGIKILGMGRFETWGSSKAADFRPVSLKIDFENVSVARVGKAEYHWDSVKVRRYRLTKPEQKSDPMA